MLHLLQFLVPSPADIFLSEGRSYNLSFKTKKKKYSLKENKHVTAIENLTFFMHMNKGFIHFTWPKTASIRSQESFFQCKKPSSFTLEVFQICLTDYRPTSHLQQFEFQQFFGMTVLRLTEIDNDNGVWQCIVQGWSHDKTKMVTKWLKCYTCWTLRCAKLVCLLQY